MNVAKSRVLDILRSRGQNDRADWVDRTMPDVHKSVQEAIERILGGKMRGRTPVAL